MAKKANKRRKTSAKEESGALHCFDCDQICCRTAVVEVESPKSLRDYSDLLFYLYHFDTQLVIAKNPGGREWFVEFMSPCRHLVNGRCSIYEYRPLVCREYDRDSCERNLPHQFRYIRTPEEFFAYIGKKAPKRILKKLMKSHIPPEGARKRKRPKTDERRRTRLEPSLN